MAKRHFLGTFWPKMALFAMGPSSKPIFLPDFQWGGTATGVGGVLSFWLFLANFSVLTSTKLIIHLF